MSGYGDQHRLLLQTLMREYALDSEEMVEELRKAGERAGKPFEVNDAVINGLIGDINAKMSDYLLGLHITSKILPELDNHKTYYVLHNNRRDNLSTSSGSEFTDYERALFKLIMTHLIQHQSATVTFKEVRTLSENDTITKSKFSGLSLDKFLAKLVERKWLIDLKEKNNKTYSGGPRMLVELQEELKNLGAPKDGDTYYLRFGGRRVHNNVAKEDEEEEDEDEDEDEGEDEDEDEDEDELRRSEPSKKRARAR
mmetsp:Transcript_4272/g.9228  ORF Transcript_4272/g.9228 Transcript_4272/m.9228 type:complete len:254 (-) Transcript_4272:170-931(-)